MQARNGAFDSMIVFPPRLTFFSIRLTTPAFISHPFSISSNLKHFFSWPMHRTLCLFKVKARFAYFHIYVIRPKPWNNAPVHCAGHPEFSLEFLRDMGILRQQRYARPSVTIQHFHMLISCLKLRRCDFCIRNDVDVHGVIEADNMLIGLLSNGFLPLCLQGSRCQARLCSSEQGSARIFAG